MKRSIKSRGKSGEPFKKAKKRGRSRARSSGGLKKRKK